ncbi:hypothetical protein H4W31_005300 [Plantactinospora soyae]|uniref:Uncharacterized protein n=1 Tax=Plantactinospora soyae TaxID=1544732 RepID=A0A927R009_9ACTN|nr:hypothetical protein [Plantactinospora soyae]
MPAQRDAQWKGIRYVGSGVLFVARSAFVVSLLRNQPENVYIEPTLASFTVGGVVLTSGLLCRWGRLFPRRIPGLRGRVVPMWFPLLLGGSAVIGIFVFGRGLLLGSWACNCLANSTHSSCGEILEVSEPSTRWS